MKPVRNSGRGFSLDAQVSLHMEGLMENWSNAKWCDVANLILGAILFFSPWIFGFDAGSTSGNAHIAGIVIAVSTRVFLSGPIPSSRDHGADSLTTFDAPAFA